MFVSIYKLKSKIMKTASFTEFRQNLKEYLQSIEDNQDVLLLSGPRKKSFIVLTLGQYEAMEETAHLLSTPANAARLTQGLREAGG